MEASAGKAMLEHGFKKLNLHRIYCGTAATNAGMKKLMVSLAVNAISSGSVDVRQWKSLPSSIYLARANLPKGKSILRIQTPTGPRAFPVTITQDNEVIHVRLFNGTAVMNNYLTGLSNDKYRVN